jgi:uncharacterized repeat protein (TIGR02543 family)
VTAGSPSGSNLLLTVTGLNPGSSATITQSTTRTGYASGTANATGVSLTGAAFIPTFGTPVATADGYTVSITNYDAAYTWLTPTVSVGYVSAGTPSGSTRVLTVTGVNPSTSSAITQVVARTGYSSGSATVTGTSLVGTALTPAFSQVVQTATGFTVSITNYSSSYTWPTPTVSAGTLSVAAAVGSSQLLTVTGLAPGSSSTITVTNTRSGYTGGSATVSGSSNFSNDTTLSALTLSSGTLSPTFASATETYTVTVANSVSSITITPTAHQINATIQARVGSNSYSLVTSGSASGALALSIGANVVTIQVTAQDGSTTGTYVVTVTRSASTDASLSGLTISAGTLTPAFTTLTTAYTVAEANSVSTITLTPAVNQAYATIQVKVGAGSYTTVNSGVATSPLALSVGANKIVILVTAQDGSTTDTYTVVATGAPPAHGITYNLGGGSGTLPTQIDVTEGLTFATASSAGLSYPGYTFNKWNNGTSNYSAGDTYTMSTSAVVLTATWTATLQTVTYLPGTGGSGSAPTQSPVATATSFTTAANTFTRTGYDFAGWSNGTTSYPVNTSYAMGINNVTLTATWTPQVYIVTYDANSAAGAASRTSDSWTYGTLALNFPTVGTMVKTGYTFAGWSTTTSGSVLTGSYTPVASITLHAIWTPNVYTVSFNTNGATGSTPATQSYTVGSAALSLPDGSGLTCPGYQFGGWASTAGGSSIGSTYTPVASIALQAIWNAIAYTISYDLNGGTSSQPASTTQTIGTTFTIATAPSQSGYVFAGWGFNSGTYSAGSIFTVGTRDIAFTAQWIPLYTVHYVMNGSSTTPPVDVLEPSGTVITLQAQPVRNGYSFTGWLDQASVSHPALDPFTVSADSTLTAVWNPIAYTVTYSLGSATGTAPTHATVTVGSTFGLASAPSWAGYTFNGWSDGLITYGGGATYLTGTQNITLTAQWSAINYTVDYDVNGASSLVPASLTKTVGQSFTLPVAPTKTGWVFDHWSDGSSTFNAAASYAMPANNVVLTAQYHAPTPTITSLSTTTGSVLGGTSTTISGTNFTLTTGVTVGGAVALFTIVSDTSLSIITPTGSSGASDVIVTTTGGTVTKSGGFTYSLLTQLPLVLTNTSGTAGTAITLGTTGGSGNGALSFMTPTSGCSVVNSLVNSVSTWYLNATHPATCSVIATKDADATFAAISTTTSVPMNKIASTVALALSANSTFASYNFTIPVSATVNTPGTVAFKDDGVTVTTCSAVATSANVATCNWTPMQIKSNKVLTAIFTPTNSVDYETTTASTFVNVMSSSLSGLNPAELSQLGSIAVISNVSTSQTFTTSDTTLTLTVPANALPAGSSVHLLLDTNGTNLQTLLGTKGYLLNTIVAWNAPDGTVPSASIPISLAITNAGIRKGMVVYGLVNGVSTPLGTAVVDGSVTVYLPEDPVLVIAPTVPDAPTSVLASNGQNQQSTVSWLVPSNNGGDPITGYTVTSSGGQSCTASGANASSCIVTGLLNGTSYTFTVTAANGVGSSTPSSQSPAITPVGPPAIITPTTGLSATYGSSFSLIITASGSTPIQSYALANGSNPLPAGLSLNSSSGEISGTPSAAGTYSAISIIATDSNLQSVTTNPFTITVNQETVTATLSITPTTIASTGSAYTVSISPTFNATGNSTGVVTYSVASGTATGCSVTGTSTLTLTATSAGTCLITATQAADSNYSSATTSPVAFTFTKKVQQTIVITTITGQVNTPIQIATPVTGSSSAALTYAVSGSGCSMTGSALTGTQLGSCLVVVTNPGDAYYFAESTTATVSIGQIPLNVPSNIVVTATSGHWLQVTFTGDTNGTTTVNLYADGTTTTALLTIPSFTSGTTIDYLTPGTTYYLTLTSIGTGNYSSSAPSARVLQRTLDAAVSPTVSVSPSSTAITLGQSVTFTATASVNDGGVLSYQWSHGGTPINGATSATYTFTPLDPSEAGQYTVVVANTKNGTQTTNTVLATLSIAGPLSITAPTTGLSGTVGTAFSVSVPAGGGAVPLSYAITSGGSDLAALGLALDSSTATVKILGTPHAAGSANVVVTVTDANSQSAATTSFTITIASATQSLAFTISPSTAVSTGTAFTARVTPTLTNPGAGIGAISYAISDGTATGCAISSTAGIETLTATTAGTCRIVATKAADSGYQAATSAPVTFTFTQATQSALTITSPLTGTYGTPFTLTTSGGMGNGTVSFAITGTGCAAVGNQLQPTQVTSCSVTATRSGDAYYAAITSPTVTINFGLAALSTPVITSVTAAGSTNSLTVTYTADSNSSSVTLNLYSAATGGSATSTTNFNSGSSISGLTPGATYYISLLSIGSSNYANSAESARTAGTTLTGALAPVIDSQPTASAAFITVGQSETLTVSAHSSDAGAISYQWYFGTNSIAGAQSNQYLFVASSSLQSGSYHVVVSESLHGTTAQSASQTLSITVAGPIQIATPSAGLTGTQGFAYSLAITASGGTAPLTYSATVGAADLIAVGLSLNASTGVISGTPTETGTVTVVVMASDAAGSTASTSPFVITLIEDPNAPTPVFSSPVQTTTGFTVTITNYDAAYSWSASITTGSITNSIPSGSNWLLTITGLTAGQSASVTVTASGSGFQPESSTITSSALGGQALVPPSFFVKISPVRISLSGNTFTITSAKLEFSYHGGGLQPALLRTQVINLMGDGKLLVTFTGITESTTITLPTIVNGMLYSAQEIVSEKDAAETFDSHNFSFEYAQWQNDRLLNRKFEQAYYVSIHDALVAHQSALGVLGVERMTQRSMGSKYFEAKAREIQAQWHQAQVMANNARQQAVRALTYSDIANLRNAGISILIP